MSAPIWPLAAAAVAALQGPALPRALADLLRQVAPFTYTVVFGYIGSDRPLDLYDDFPPGKRKIFVTDYQAGPYLLDPFYLAATRPVAPGLYRLRDMADDNSSHDFGNDIIPQIVKNGKAVAHKFADSCVTAGLEDEPYWRDVGTIDAFWQANIDLTDFVPKLDLYDNSWPIWTYAELVPPEKFIHDEDWRRGSAMTSWIDREMRP